MASQNHIPPRYNAAMVAVAVLFDQLKEPLHLPHMQDMRDCWEYQVDSDWWFATNAHRGSRLCSRGFTVPPKHTIITYRRWVVGTVGIHGGHWVERPGATERDFVRAVRGLIGAVSAA